MAREHILVVDDEEDILELVQYNLTKHGYESSGVTTGEMAISKSRSVLPDLIILDLMLPGVDGLEVCKLIKNDPKTSRIPVLMLTAKGEEADIVTGLELGADDYVTKPFSPRVLIARVKTLLRRSSKAPADADALVKFEDVLIDPERHEVKLKGRPVLLTHSEFKLLHVMLTRPGRVFTRDQIIDHVHGVDYAVTPRSVDVLVAGLRKKLGESAQMIETVRGVGYRMKD